MPVVNFDLESDGTPLTDLAARHGASPFMVLLAAFKALLHRYTHQSDILVGSPVAGRNRLETEELIGFFINTLVLRTDLSRNPSFEDLLHRVRETTLGAHAHQERDQQDDGATLDVTQLIQKDGQDRAIRRRASDIVADDGDGVGGFDQLPQ